MQFCYFAKMSVAIVTMCVFIFFGFVLLPGVGTASG